MAWQSDSSSDSDSKDQPIREPTSSEIFFTPEERELRRQYRMGKSEICLSELWKLYNKLVVKWRVPEEMVPEENDDLLTYSEIDFAFVEDPTDDKRQAFLARKYKYLLDGLAYLIHCPEKPYLLTQKSRELDSPGRRHVLPRALRASRPEVFATTAPPFEGTVSYTRHWLNVCNLNFEVMRGRAQQYTQTEALDIYQTCRIPLRFQQHPEKGPKSTVDDSLKITTSESIHSVEEDIQVDLLDIPLDDDGNPIGKRTGYCEWCKQEIFPIPTPHVLSTIWERRKLYCCAKYRELVEEILELELRLLTEKRDSELLIDVRHRIKPEQLLNLDPELAAHVTKKQAEGSIPTALSKQAKDAHARIKASRAVAWTRKQEDSAQDTSDLVWDPFETRYAKPKPFKNMPFDESMEHFYQHIQVVLTQSGMYFGVPIFDDLGDLSSISRQAAEQTPQPGAGEKTSA